MVGVASCDKARDVGDQKNDQDKFCQCQETDHCQGGDRLAHMAVGDLTFQPKNRCTHLCTRSYQSAG